MISVFKYEICENHQFINDEINRCNTRLKLARSGDVFFNANLSIEKNKENSITEKELVLRICDSVMKALTLSADCPKKGPPFSLFLFRKNLKEFCKDKKLQLEGCNSYQLFNNLYKSKFKIFKRSDSITDQILQKRGFIVDAEKTFLSSYIKSINSEFYFLQEQLDIYAKHLSLWKKRRETKDKYGKLDEDVALELGPEVPFSLCSLLKELHVKSGNVSVQHILSVKKMVERKPGCIKDKDQFIKWFYRALILYLDIRALNGEGQLKHRLDNIKYRGINARYFDLTHSYQDLTKKIKQYLNEDGVKDLPIEGQIPFALEIQDWKFNFLRKRVRIFNDDFNQSVKKYEDSIKLVGDYLKSTEKHKIVSFIRNNSTLFCKEVSISSFSELTTINVQDILDNAFNDPLLKAYEDIISFLEELPEQEMIDSAQVPSIEELDRCLSNLDLNNKIIASSSQIEPVVCENVLQLQNKYHDRVSCWFGSTQDPLKNNAKYRNLAEDIKEKIRLFHNFSSNADYFVLTKGVKIEDLQEYPGSSQYALPCIIKTRDKEYRGKVIYCVDKETGVIWHRCFNENGYETFRTDYINDTIWIKDVDFPKLSSTASKSKNKQKSTSTSKKVQPAQDQALIDDGSKVLEETSAYVRISDPKNKAEIILDIE